MNIALSTQSSFSVGSSLLQPSDIAEKAKEFGYNAVALVDTMSLSGLVDFSNQCKKNDVQPIIGCRLDVYDDVLYRKPPKSSGEKEKENAHFQLKVYVKSEQGLKSLFKLLTDANSDAQYYYQPRTDLNAVLALDDVVVTTGDMFNVFSHKNHHDIVKKLRDKFQDDFYVELCPINSPLFDRTNNMALETLTALKVKSVVTYPFNYTDNADADTLDVLSAIVSNVKLDAPFRSKQYVKEFGFFEPKEILNKVKQASLRQAKFESTTNLKPWVDGIKNAAEIASKAVYTFEKMNVTLPKFGENEFKLLCEKCAKGWRERFGKEVLGHKPSIAELNSTYKERLAFELGILKSMKFESYFLLVEDLVTWAKNNDVIVGPGRGSCGGSLVAYLLGITDVDPVRFGLIFERFINPHRLDLPDADLDFASSVRYKVVDYLTEKYGKDHVAGISNYSTLASASALRDTGRMYGLTPLELSASKLVLKVHGASLSLDESAKTVPELEKFKHEHSEVWNHAVKLNGAIKSFSQHAAGVVVSGEPISNRAILETRTGSPLVNWDKRSVELWGLVKMDLLGLSTLDTLQIAKEYIKERHGVDLNLLNIPLDDRKTLDALANGDTTGVFQLESKGMQNLLRNVAKGGALSFEDICAVTALYRPGPMDSGLMDDYVRVRQGLAVVEYDHPSMKPALEETLGIIIYQEQVMKIAVDVAGFSGSESDTLRKSIGKKDAKMMSEMRDAFVSGAELGYIEVETEGGSTFQVHRGRKFKCTDGEMRTVEEAIADLAEITSFTF